MTEERPVSFGISLVSGGIAGTAVDVILFPLDTLKTRLQSAHGLVKSGGFRGIYAGLFSAASGSAPSAATFFCSYELTKNVLKPHVSSSMFPFVHMCAATIGEVVALFVRNPFEVVKQRAQAYTHLSSTQALRYTLAEESVWSWEQGFQVWPWQSSICGAVSGGVAAAVTNPLDVAKTRVMLAPKDSLYTQASVTRVLLIIKSQEGFSGLFSGVTMRTTWITIGGAVFFGFYEKAKYVLQEKFEMNTDHRISA
ncbi:mitochondrial S-adenosylmethionine carrier protein-like isoform X2 [Porites lutea]|uniref:mitochondrial S-adenosylmethionine carrier protein-like isoform X2 n=1 Tax=Porites lutea TaxID=51062 RepID=UPI003CC684C5